MPFMINDIMERDESRSLLEVNPKAFMINDIMERGVDNEKD